MESFIIQEKDELLRRVSKVPSHFNNGRITSAAFKPKPNEDGLSVDLLRLTTVNIFIKDPDKYLAAGIIAEDAMKEGCECIYDPLPDKSCTCFDKRNYKQIS